MKKLIYISGITCANLLMFGCMFKIMHWPGANILLVLSIFLFCFLFLPFALLNNFQGQEQKKYKWLYIVTFIVFFVGMMGTLFKIMHWPGAGMFLLVGIPLPFILFLPVYLYQTRNEKKDETLNFLGIMFGLIFLAVFSTLLAMNLSRNVLDQVALNVRYNDNSALFSQSVSSKDNMTDIKKQANEICEFIDVLKCDLFAKTQNDVCENNKLKSDYDPLQINNRDYEIPINFLHKEENNNVVETLKLKINNYREMLLASGKMNAELTELCNYLFDVSNRPENENPSWEQREFTSNHLIVVLDVLSKIQSNVRLVEAEYLALK